jgi:hypothetical protein
LIYEPQKAVVEKAEPAFLVGGKGGIHPLAWEKVCPSCKMI